MSTRGLSAATLVAALLGVLAPSAALAFHSGGVAECEGCHTMHNTKGSGKAVPLANGVGNGAIYLLQGTDQSSACLNCHNSADTAPSGYHVSTDDSMFTTGLVSYSAANKPPVEATPAGDFGWLKVDRNVTIRGSVIQALGEEHGHSIIAVDYGYRQDARPERAASPGGTYPSANLACTSCHDPHGRYRRDASGAFSTTGLPIFTSGSYATSPNPIAGTSAVGAYRILAGKAYEPRSTPGHAFTADPPDAVAPSTYNRLETAGQTHVAYGRGMSEWCANCHPAMLENAYVSGEAGHRHPAGNGAKLTAEVVANYNAYVSSGRMTNVDPTKAYSTLAPFELGTGDYAILKSLAVITDTKDESASATANVSCLSCHRSHASAFACKTRFFLENEFMTVADASNVAKYDDNATENKINYGLNPAEQQQAYYGRPASAFGPYARNYCNKCHAKD